MYSTYTLCEICQNDMYDLRATATLLPERLLESSKRYAIPDKNSD